MGTNRQRMGHKPVESFIKFELMGTSKSGLTNVWRVVNTNFDEEIGQVYWHGAWRKYVYFTPLDSIYDWECMRLIADFIEKVTLEHRNNRHLIKQAEAA